MKKVNKQNKQENKTIKEPKLQLVWILLGLIIVILALIILSRNGFNFGPKKSSNIERSIFKPPVLPIAHGRQEYATSYGSGSKGPNITHITLDPIDPKKGGRQAIRVSVKNNTQLRLVTAILQTDNKKTSYRLRLVQGNNNSGAWEGAWKMDDTYDYAYTIQIKAHSWVDSSDVILTVR